MKEDNQGNRHARGIVLVTHIVTAMVKIIGFLFSGSAVLMNESIHSVIDCLNQGLLAIGEKRAQRGRSELYQFGEGRATYFFSTVVAMTVFFGGGLLAVIEAGQNLFDPAHEVTNIQFVVAILFAGLFVESSAVQRGWQEIKQQNTDKQPLFTFLKESRESEILLGFTEDLFALISVSIALIGILLTALTNNPLFDSLGGIIGGVLLVIVAGFLGKEFYSLLIGESASKSDLKKIQQTLATEEVTEVTDLRTLHLGPDELLVVAELVIQPKITSDEYAVIDRLEQEIRTQLAPKKNVYLFGDGKTKAKKEMITEGRSSLKESAYFFTNSGCFEC
ncbi:cation diffusion facilitator family transporter [Enterococcus sp.]|uniref:cation diffusion facilitator family transporter n=1 Tax=Enterococcus sp. TaxID=35783 RepID=UPI0025C5F24A|nr:cation diffusion facilitator family transporter [Enterococcus sp.]